jgi:hypothetical protein
MLLLADEVLIADHPNVHGDRYRLPDRVNQAADLAGVGRSALSHRRHSGTLDQAAAHGRFQN